ncbi:MAG TPA: DNA-3-methyladenine glycosylase [Terriglobales bacterium]|nr:DNA-3-methyladenine glycosylase [Terriglobales bacterium]
MKQAIAHLKQADPILAAIITRVGPLKPRYAPPTFENLVRSIAYQQLNGKAAATIFQRLADACGGAIDPAALEKLSDADLRRVGMSKQKSSYLRDLAHKTNTGEIDFARLPELPDEEVITQLTKIKGVGTWTAQMFLMFALRRPNVMPTGDFGINLAIRKAYRMRKMPKPKRVLQISKKWQPYCSLACYYLWRSIDGDKKQD